MTINDIVSTLEQFAPLNLQLEWDNSGKQVGDFSKEAAGALLTLDITENSIETAKKMGANLIISHHPLIFSGLKSITGASPVERIVIEAIRCGIAIYSAHTNIDAAEGGVSWAMARKLGLQNVAPLCENGIGCIGDLEKSEPLDTFISRVKNAYSLPYLKINANPTKNIRKVAVLGGSGAHDLQTAIDCEADAMVTGDVKYHDFQRASGNITLADVGHYESEIDVLGIFLDIIQKKYPTFALHTEKLSFAEIK